MLRAAAGRSRVQMLAYDSARHAVLLEELGRQLARLGLPLVRQLEIICETLQELWAVLVHGDGHAWNTLELRHGESARFHLIDPDGLHAEPECDVAISMREYNDELMGGNPLELGRRRAQALAAHTGADAQRIWEWGFIERVSTGLLLMRTDKDAVSGRMFLRIARSWTGA